MTIYYKKIDVWCPYPFQDTIDYRYVAYSTSRKKFKEKVFLETDVSLTAEERLKEVKKHFPKTKKLEKL